MNNWATEKQFYNIITRPDQAEILLYGYIGNLSGNDSKNFLSDFKNLEAKYNQINVRINSGGGDVFEGIAIYNSLKNSTATIHVYIDGLAASVASIIALAGNKIYMSRFAQLMIHKVSGNVNGDSDKFRATANLMDEVEKSLLEIYAERTGLTKEFICSEWLQRGKDSWFNAGDAIKNKLVDEIFDGVVNKSPNKILNEMEVWNFYDTQIHNKTNIKSMELKNTIINQLGLAVDASETDVVNAIQVQAKIISDLKSDNQSLKDQLAEYESKFKIEQQQKVKDLIDNAIQSHRINEENRLTYTTLAEANYEATKSAINAITPYKSIMNQLVTDEEQTEYKTFREYQVNAPEISNGNTKRNLDKSLTGFTV